MTQDTQAPLVGQHTYEVKIDPNKGPILFKDGRATQCHHQQPILTEGQVQGSLQVIPTPCSTQCVMAQLLKRGDELMWGTSCDGVRQLYTLSASLKEEPTDNKPKLVLTR